MTAITEPAAREHLRLPDGPDSRTLERSLEAAWPRLAFAGVIALAAVLYVWNLTVSGYANTYYSAAALSASQSWSAWFFGSFDASNFITVDKPPLSTMLMGLSVRLFGLSSWTILLPEALAGVATVAVLFLAVKRSFGPAAATIAGVVMALTPAAVLIFRFNNPDALLTLLLVAAGYALLRSLEHGSYRWMTAAAACVGLAFLTKYLQAYLVLPAFALVFGFSANTTLRRRLVGLVAALVTVIVTSGWWVAIFELLPAGSRPYAGGSQTGSVLDLIFGYDGLGRIFGAAGPGGGVGANFGGEADPLRLFNDQWFGQIAWFIPLAVACLVVGLWLRRHAPRTDIGLAGYLLWGGWFAVTAIVFSYMSGIVHTYYAVALAPAVAALVGAGLVDLWGLRLPGLAGRRVWLGGLAVGLASLATAWFGWQLLDRTPDFGAGVGSTAVVLGSLALAALVVASVPVLRERAAVRRMAVAAASVGLLAALLAPGAYAVDTTGMAYGGGDPHPGPGTPSESGFGGLGGGPGGFGGGQSTWVVGFTGLPGDGGGVGGNTSDTLLLNYLVANRGSASWIVAVSGSQEAGSIELATGLPVMAMGGFTGSDPTPTLDQLKSYIASGKLRFVMASLGGGGFGGPGGFGGFGASSSSVSSWVTSACTAVNYGGYGTGNLYDCAGAAG
jgi:4-amino-4-deoxy-L-arabinose transferase-like glycosyltransferase